MVMGSLRRRGAVSALRESSRARAVTDAARRLAILLEDPRWVASIALADIPGLLIQLAAVQAQLAGRTLGTQAAADRDELLTVEVAAKRLGHSTTWLYRHAKKLPFTVPIGRRIRFSARRLDTYIATHVNGRYGTA